MRRRKNKRQIQIVIGLTLCFLFVMTAGYAAFSTNLTLKAKGNIINTPSQCFTVQDNGDGTGTIKDYDITCGTKVNIPKYINNLTITQIADGVHGSEKNTGPFTEKNITSVIIPNTITKIGYISFFGSSLKKVVIPSSVKEIGAQAFAFNELEEVELNEGLEKTGSEVFTYNNLKSIKIPDSLKMMGNGIATANLIEGDSAFIYGKDEQGDVDKSILNSFANRNAKTIEFPSNIKQLNTLSLYNMANISELNIPDTIEVLNEKFFYRLENLETINIGTGIKAINTNAFSGISTSLKLKTININRKANSIPGAPWGTTGVTINWTGTN